MSKELLGKLEEEDLRVRQEIKDACYTCEDEKLQERVSEIIEKSKERQRALFNEHFGWNEPTKENSDPVFRLHFPSPDYEKA